MDLHLVTDYPNLRFKFLYDLACVINSGSACPLLMARHRQVVSRISKGSQNILIYNFIITTFDCQDGGISARAFSLPRPGVAPALVINLICIIFLKFSLSASDYSY